MPLKTLALKLPIFFRWPSNYVERFCWIIFKALLHLFHPESTRRFFPAHYLSCSVFHILVRSKIHSQAHRQNQLNAWGWKTSGMEDIQTISLKNCAPDLALTLSCQFQISYNSGLDGKEPANIIQSRLRKWSYKNVSKCTGHSRSFHLSFLKHLRKRAYRST